MSIPGSDSESGTVSEKDPRSIMFSEHGTRKKKKFWKREYPWLSI